MQRMTGQIFRMVNGESSGRRRLVFPDMGVAWGRPCVEHNHFPAMWVPMEQLGMRFQERRRE
jgi:hypothetical protein